jgi:hypothetical protein
MEEHNLGINEYTRDHKEWMKNREAKRSIGRAIKLDREGHTDSALELIYDGVEVLVDNGEYGKLSTIIHNMPVDVLSTEFLIMLLTVTLPYKDKINCRAREILFEDVKEKLGPECDESLLIGLE